MFEKLNFHVTNPEKIRDEIEECRSSNQSHAHMLQSLLNEHEKQQGLPITKIVEPVRIFTNEDVK